MTSADLTVPPPKMTLDEFFAEAKRLNLRMPLTHEQMCAAFDAKDAEIAALSERIAALLRAVPPLPVVATVSKEGFYGPWRAVHWRLPVKEQHPNAELTYKADAEAAIASLQARLEAAERDAARLDHLQAWSERGRALGYKWDAFTFRCTDTSGSVRDQLDGHIAVAQRAAIDSATQENERAAGRDPVVPPRDRPCSAPAASSRRTGGRCRAAPSEGGAG